MEKIKYPPEPEIKVVRLAIPMQGGLKFVYFNADTREFLGQVTVETINPAALKFVVGDLPSAVAPATQAPAPQLQVVPRLS
jgi:hypothetical protein